jgi:hypothetical protein
MGELSKPVIADVDGLARGLLVAAPISLALWMVLIDLLLKL